MTFEIIWTYEVEPAQRAAFERAYGADGDWSRRFQRNEGFLEVVRAGCPPAPPKYPLIPFLSRGGGCPRGVRR